MTAERAPETSHSRRQGRAGPRPDGRTPRGRFHGLRDGDGSDGRAQGSRWIAASLAPCPTPISGPRRLTMQVENETALIQNAIARASATKRRWKEACMAANWDLFGDEQKDADGAPQRLGFSVSSAALYASWRNTCSS